MIENADEITVVMSDRREFDARVLLTDERTDIAVLKIDPGTGNLAPFWSLPIPTNLKSATSCWPSAIRSASGRR